MRFLAWLGALALSALGAAAAEAATIDDSLAKLAAEAAKAGSVIWYESSPDDQAAKIVAAFSKRFPDVKLEHIRDTGGNSIGARIVQESQGGARTADLATVGNSILTPLIERGLAAKVDWTGYGIAQKLTPSPYALSLTAVTYVILYNTEQVKEADAPKNWDDLLNPRWNGKLGLWVRAEGEGGLAAAWGEDKVAAYIKKLNANHPVLEKSTFPLAQQVAAGELLVGLGIYHTAQPPLKRGAPIKIVFPNPVSVQMLYDVVPAQAKNAAGGKLLALWLATPEGGRAYEDATDRGNPLLEGTKTEAMLRGRTLSEFPPDQAKREAEIVERFNKLLESGATQ
ncbi:MAG TPA: extracellular solute-binding protein [Stellaceae bacterium]|nr:extracellular solute-binding protein [Stellaceae bacterium]